MKIGKLMLYTNYYFTTLHLKLLLFNTIESLLSVVRTSAEDSIALDYSNQYETNP